MPWLDGARLAPAVTVSCAVLASCLLVVQASRAASTASLETPDNAWRTGIVEIDTDSGASALFQATRIVPGQTGSNCLVVDYSGSLPASVRMWADTSGALASSLAVTIQEGSGGAAGDCTGFTPSATLFGPDPLSKLKTDHGDAAHGLSTWAPDGPATRTFRVAWALAGGNSAQNKTATADFHWVAVQRSS
jgi:hypothetical protein